MRYLCAGLVLVLLAAPLPADERFDVRVLYCGDPGSAREADYGSFLKRNFAHVTLRDAREFQEWQTDGQDVVIFDWSSVYDGKGNYDHHRVEKFHRPQLSQRYARPTILIGWAGGMCSSRLKLKINWLCLCLSGPAHHLRLGHPLFHSPLEAAPKLEDVPTPANYPFLSIETLGPTIKAWKVQKRNYPDVDPGLVSTLYGFNDSPDAEVIAQGFAAKGPDTVTLGRHANFFLWGFSASPSDMTPEAQRLFVNAVCYMRQFDGQSPMIRSESSSREWALRLAAGPRVLSEEFKRQESRFQRAQLKEHPEWVPEASRGDVDAYIAKRVDEMQANNKKWLPESLPADVLKKFGLDADKLVAYYRENLEYLRPTRERPPQFAVDEDAKAVGPSNRKIELLDRCIARLEKHDQPDLALRLLKRYTQENFETATQWRNWLDANRGRLFFSDVGGYKFFVARLEKPARATSVGAR